MAVCFGMLVPFVSWLTCTFSDPSALLHIVCCHVLPRVSISYDWSNEVSCVLSWSKLLPTNLARRHHCWRPVVVMEFCRVLLSSLLWDFLTLLQAEMNDQEHWVSKLCNAWNMHECAIVCPWAYKHIGHNATFIFTSNLPSLQMEVGHVCLVGRFNSLFWTGHFFPVNSSWEAASIPLPPTAATPKADIFGMACSSQCLKGAEL